MIQIDLLPQEYRRAERTAPALFFATVGLVALFGTAAAFCAWGWFGVVGAAQNDALTAREILDSKQPQAAYSDLLEKEKKDYTARLDHIREFSDSRILWTKKLDQLATLIDTPADQDRHMVWLQSLNMKMDGARDQGISLKGKSATGLLKKLSDFNTDLKTTPFFERFTAISPPAGKVAVEEEFDPPTALEFEVALSLMNQADDKKKKAPARPAPTSKAPATPAAPAGN